MYISIPVIKFTLSKFQDFFVLHISIGILKWITSVVNKIGLICHILNDRHLPILWTSFFFMRPSNIEENLKLYTLHTKTFFSIYPKTVRNIQCTPKTDRNETLWHMTKNETSLKSSSPQKNIRPGFYWFLS